jgi:hypothetical protein
VKTKLKNALKKTLLIFLSIFFTLAAVEIGLRLYYFKSIATPQFYHLSSLMEAHPEMGWIYRSNLNVNLQTLDYANVLETNSKEYRDTEHDVRKKPGVFRIVILGDSFMDAHHVNFEDSLPQRLQTCMKERNIEIINLGIRAYGTVQQYLSLKNEGLKYKPDLVILAFFPMNEPIDNSYRFNRLLWGEDSWRTFARPYTEIDKARESGASRAAGPAQFKVNLPDYKKCSEFFQRKQRGMRKTLKRMGLWEKTVIYKLYTLFKKSRLENSSVPNHDPNAALGTVLQDFDPGLYPKGGMTTAQYREAWREAWETTALIINDIKKTASASGAQFVLFSVPAKIQVEADYFNLVKKRLPRLKFELRKVNNALAEFSVKQNNIILTCCRTSRNTTAKEEKGFFMEKKTVTGIKEVIGWQWKN